jgi:predicted enzyme related to lactoylglutathione lyase
LKRIIGLGGIFFKAKNPKKMAAWYRRHLQIPIKDDYAVFAWKSTADPKHEGHTVWSLLPGDTKYLGKSSSTFMVNYRVRNLKKVLAELKKEGVTVEKKVEEYPYGKFGWITDPEGNRIELWEPPERYTPPTTKNIVLSA